MQEKVSYMCFNEIPVCFNPRVSGEVGTSVNLGSSYPPLTLGLKQTVLHRNTCRILIFLHTVRDYSLFLAVLEEVILHPHITPLTCLSIDVIKTTDYINVM